MQRAVVSVAPRTGPEEPTRDGQKPERPRTKALTQAEPSNRSTDKSLWAVLGFRV